MLNRRLAEIGRRPSAIRELFEFGRQRAAVVGRENVLDFSLGNPSVPPPRQVREAIDEALASMGDLQLHGYTSAAGDEGARNAIAAGLNARYGTGYTAANLCLTAGCAPALTACIAALTEGPDSEFIALAPFFPEYSLFATTAGASLKVVPPELQNFQVDFAALEHALTPNTRGIIVNSPNNPSGTVLEVGTLCRLAELLTKKSNQYSKPIFIISDEPYRELVYCGKAPFVAGFYPNTLVCYSFSKSLSLPGERIGYVLVPGRVHAFEDVWAAIMAALRLSGHVCAPSLMQHVAARCHSVPPNLEAYRQNRDLLHGELSAMGYRSAKPDGAFYLFVEAPGCTSAEFCKTLMQKDVLAVPGDSFGCPTHFRLCYCVEQRTILRALPVFKAAMGAYSGRGL